MAFRWGGEANEKAGEKRKAGRRKAEAGRQMAPREEFASALTPTLSPRSGRIAGRWLGWHSGLEHRMVVGPKRQRAGRTVQFPRSIPNSLSRLTLAWEREECPRSSTAMINADHLRYAGFWPRLGALLLDGLFTTPLTLIYGWGSSHFRLFDLYSLVPWLVFQLFWDVWLVRRFGGTPGKLLMGLRIRKVNGEAAGYREALLRCSVDLSLGLLATIAGIMAATHMTDHEFLTLGWTDQVQRQAALMPAWGRGVNIALPIWAWGELIVLLTNRKRRALHDFLAGTVVVHADSLSAPESTVVVPPELSVP